MSDHTEVADVLDSAADYIEKNGWVKGHPGIDGDARCAFLALGAVTSSMADAGAAAFALRQITGADSVATWNDAPDRTEQEVLDALRGAAKAERRLADVS